MSQPTTTRHGQPRCPEICHISSQRPAPGTIPKPIQFPSHTILLGLGSIGAGGAFFCCARRTWAQGTLDCPRRRPEMAGVAEGRGVMFAVQNCRHTSPPPHPGRNGPARCSQGAGCASARTARGGPAFAGGRRRSQQRVRKKSSAVLCKTKHSTQVLHPTNNSHTAVTHQKDPPCIGRCVRAAWSLPSCCWRTGPTPRTASSRKDGRPSWPRRGSTTTPATPPCFSSASEAQNTARRY